MIARNGIEVEAADYLFADRMGVAIALVGGGVGDRIDLDLVTARWLQAVALPAAIAEATALEDAQRAALARESSDAPATFDGQLRIE